MAQVMGSIRSFVKDEEGATMVEYGLMVALIAVVCATIVATLGTTLQGKFQTVCNTIKGSAC